MLERGLSAYECEPAGDKWRAKGPAWDKWKKERSYLSPPHGPWFLLGGYKMDGPAGGDGEPLLASAWLIAGLVEDAVDAVFSEAGQVSPAIENHPGYREGACRCLSAQDVAAGEDEDLELFENLAGAEALWADLSQDERDYYSDAVIDKREVTLSQYCRNAALRRGAEDVEP